MSVHIILPYEILHGISFNKPNAKSMHKLSFPNHCNLMYDMQFSRGSLGSRLKNQKPWFQVVEHEIGK